MKKIAYFAVILVLAILTVFAGRDDADLFSGRKPVGKLTIYTSMSEDVIKSLDTDLKKQFPDCKIKFVYGGISQIQARIAMEQGAGKLGCDILLVAEPSYSLELKEKGLLHRYISGEASTIMTIADKWSANSNIRSAEIITDWFLSPQGQNAIVAGWMHSVRKDFEVIPYASISTVRMLMDSMPLNWESIFRRREDIQIKFEELVTYRR